MGITEWLANLPIHIVIITIVVLIAIRFASLRKGTQAAKTVAEVAESLAVAMGLVFLIIRPFVVQAFFIPSASMHPTLVEHDHIMVNKFVYRFCQPARGDVIVFLCPPEATPDGVERDFIKRVIAVPGDIVRITPGYVTVGNEQIGHDRLRGMLSPLQAEGSVRLVSHKAVLVDGEQVPLGRIARKAECPRAAVRVVPGQVYVNGKPIRESYVAEDPDGSYPGGPRSVVKPEWIVIDKDGNQAIKVPKGKLLVMGDNRNESFDSRSWGLLECSRVRGKAMFIFWPLNRIKLIR